LSRHRSHHYYFPLKTPVNKYRRERRRQLTPPFVRQKHFYAWELNKGRDTGNIGAKEGDGDGGEQK
jgi:hypothetical protein